MLRETPDQLSRRYGTGGEEIFFTLLVTRARTPVPPCDPRNEPGPLNFPGSAEAKVESDRLIAWATIVLRGALQRKPPYPPPRKKHVYDRGAVDLAYRPLLRQPALSGENELH